MKPFTPRAAAARLHALGFNVTTIAVGGKEPAHEWNSKRAPWAMQRQPLKVVQSLPYDAAERIYKGCVYPAIDTVGIVNGINNRRTIDVDPIVRDGEKQPVPAEVRAALVDALGLPLDYDWSGPSSSSKGLHIIIECGDALPEAWRVATKKDEAGVVVFAPLPAYADAFDHIELRWERCQTKLPSPTGYNGHLPDAPPAVVTMERLAAALATIATPRQRVALAPQRATSAPRPERRSDGHQDVIGQFNARYTVDDVLTDLGYTRTGAGWAHPHTSQPGVTGLKAEGERVRSYSATDPLNDGMHSHDAFSVFCELAHSGDVRAAVKAAAALLNLPPLVSPSSPSSPNSPTLGWESNGRAMGELGDGGSVPPSRFIVLNEEDLAHVAPPRWLLPGECYAGAYHLIYGASGSGKTFYAVDRAMRVAALGKRALYIATEDLPGLKTKVAAWRAAYPQAGGRLTWLQMDGLNLADERQVDDLLATLAGQPYDLITVDTLREAHTGDENSSLDMSRVNRAVQRLIRDVGAAVDVVHHSGVNEGRERGSTALMGNLDLKFKVSNDDGRVAIENEKHRYGALLAPTYSHLTPVGESGSCVLRPAGAMSFRHDAPLSRNERAVLQTLALSIFEGIGAKSAALGSATGIANGPLYRALSTLKNRGYLYQDGKGDPYSITSEGRAALGPELITSGRAVENTPIASPVLAPALPGSPIARTAAESLTPNSPTALPPFSHSLHSTSPTPTPIRVGEVGECGRDEQQHTPPAAGLFPDAPAAGPQRGVSRRQELADRYEALTDQIPPTATVEQLVHLVAMAERLTLQPCMSGGAPGWRLVDCASGELVQIYHDDTAARAGLAAHAQRLAERAEVAHG